MQERQQSRSAESVGSEGQGPSVSRRHDFGSKDVYPRTRGLWVMRLIDAAFHWNLAVSALVIAHGATGLTFNKFAFLKP